MRTPGDLEMIFCNPITNTGQIGMARLIQKLAEDEHTELWEIEFLDDEGHFYQQKLKKQPNGTKET